MNEFTNVERGVAVEIAGVHADNGDAWVLDLKDGKEVAVPKAAALVPAAGPSEGDVFVNLGDAFSIVPKARFDQHWRNAGKPKGKVVAGASGFDWALGRLKDGASVARKGWNGKGMRLFLIPVASHNAKIQQPFIAIVPVDGKAVPWVASQVDLLADDWMEVDA